MWQSGTLQADVERINSSNSSSSSGSCNECLGWAGLGLAVLCLVGLSEVEMNIKQY